MRLRAIVRPAAASSSGRSVAANRCDAGSKYRTLPDSSVIPKPCTKSAAGKRAIARRSVSTGIDEPP